MRIKEFVDAGGVVEVGTTMSTLSVPGELGKSAVKIPTRYFFSIDADEVEILESFVKILYNLIPKKSKEEIAAEESVKKAEEALKAAKSVLEKVKESK